MKAQTYKNFLKDFGAFIIATAILGALYKGCMYCSKKAGIKQKPAIKSLY